MNTCRTTFQDVICSNVALTACEASWPRACQLMDDVSASSLLLDVFSYSPAMASESWRRSTGLLGEMEIRGLRTDMVCYSSVLAAGGTLPWQHAGQILSAMSLRRLAGNQACLKAATAALGHRWEVALAPLASWHQWGRLNPARLISQIRGTWATCLQLVEMHARGDVFGIGAALMEFQTQQQWQLALGLFQQTVHGSLEPDSYLRSVTITAPAAQGMWATKLNAQV